MSLQSTLDEMAAASAAKIPAEAKAVMQAQLQDLINSGQADRATSTGDAAPDFKLAGPDGDVSLGDLTAKGPVVLTWFRGSW
ncbi:MAG: hypothetical protein AAGG01_12685 [Planctomycetota bacterium]